ncbi:MAG: oxidoreductase [Deltaproteobacteria bacterium]|nr:oxidoreductase [Deltaproteobacteria bacterium]
MEKETPSLKVAFLCLGVMGFPMAGHLARAGYSVSAYNRTRARLDAWLEAHEDSSVRGADSPAQAAGGADFVFVCTGNDADLRDVLLGEDGALSAMGNGACLVDHTTASAKLAQEMAALARQSGVGWLDAPVSGGQAGAEAGTLTIMVGGEESEYRRAVPLLEVYAKKHLRMGPAGAGQLTKMVNQICIGGLIQALSEGLHFAEQVGLDANRVVDVISEGAAGSWQMENRAKSMIERRFDFGFAVEWMRKDLGMALTEAQRVKAKMPLTEQVDAFYEEVEARGGSRLDTSSLITLLDLDGGSRKD